MSFSLQTLTEKKIRCNKILLSSKLFGYVRHCNHLVSITGRVEDGDDKRTLNKLGQFRGTIKKIFISSFK